MVPMSFPPTCTPTPYRDSARRAAARCVSVRIPVDALVLVAGAAAVALLKHWPRAVEAFSTAVLGFPSLRG